MITLDEIVLSRLEKNALDALKAWAKNNGNIPQERDALWEAFRMKAEAWKEAMDEFDA